MLANWQPDGAKLNFIVAPFTPLMAVAPFTGAWLETFSWLPRCEAAGGRSLHGSVDRNTGWMRGMNLQRLRREKGLSQEELAHSAHIHQTYLGGVEGGKRNPSVGVLERITGALGADIEELFRRSRVERGRPAAWAKNMRRLRAERGLSQEALAHESGMGRTYLSGVERSERNVSVDNIARIEGRGVEAAPRWLKDRDCFLVRLAHLECRTQIYLGWAEVLAKSFEVTGNCASSRIEKWAQERLERRMEGHDRATAPRAATFYSMISRRANAVALDNVTGIGDRGRLYGIGQLRERHR
jgi:transcriptional regulator with XRE-family HTH domain